MECGMQDEQGKIAQQPPSVYVIEEKETYQLVAINIFEGFNYQY